MLNQFSSFSLITYFKGSILKDAPNGTESFPRFEFQPDKGGIINEKIIEIDINSLFYNTFFFDL